MPLERRGEHRTLACTWGQAGNCRAAGRFPGRSPNSFSYYLFEWALEFVVPPGNPTPEGGIPSAPWKSLYFNRLP